MRGKYNQGTAFWFPNCIWQWRLFVLLSRRTWRRVCQSTRHHSWQRENLPPPCGWKNSCRQSFVGKTGAKEAIYSYGHRNPQGLAKHPTTGAIWDQEHGPKGGDEINIIKKGANYGLPVTYGIDYDGTTISDKPPGIEDPIYYWVPSIAPAEWPL
jgi:hypothetical protein